MNPYAHELLEAALSEDPLVIDDVTEALASAFIDTQAPLEPYDPESWAWFLLLVREELLSSGDTTSWPKVLPAAEQVELEFFTHGGRLESQAGQVFTMAVIPAPQLFLLLQDLMAGRETRAKTPSGAFIELTNRGWGTENPLSALKIGT